MSVERATETDLNTVLSWLESEYKEDGDEGLWCNRRIIQRSFEDGDLWVIREDGEAVAFQVGDYTADIACVRKDRQLQGLGTHLFEASWARAMQDNVNVLSGECAPRTSLPFWQKLGFERYGNVSDGAPINVRLVLKRDFEIPAGLPSAEVTIGFYPEAALYDAEVLPISEYPIAGARCDANTVLLSKRAIGLMDDVPQHGDLVVKINVDSTEICFCKAKYPEAGVVGVKHDRQGRSFYVDVVKVPGD